MIAIITCGTDKDNSLSEILTKLGYENETLEINSKNIKKINDYDAVFLHGSPTTLDSKNKQKILNTLDFFTELNVPVLAIGFGHQIIGLLHGSNYSESEYINSPTKIGIVNRGEKLFRGIRKKIFHQDHNYEITLPDNFRLLAYSPSSQNEAMKHVDKDLYSLQFYPDLSGSAGAKLIENFLEITGD